MMQGPKTALHVRARAHLFGGTDEDTHTPGVHGIEQFHLGKVGVSVVDEGDLALGDTGGDEPRADFLVDVEPGRVRRREIAENELR